MFLKRLCEYTERKGKSLPPAYQEINIRYVVCLDKEGKYKGIIEQKQSIIAPHTRRSSGVKPKLLVENGEYVLGIARPDSDQRKVQERHQAYKELLLDCAEQTQLPQLWLAHRYLEQIDRTILLKDKPDLDPTANMTIVVDETDYLYLFQYPEIQAYWAAKEEIPDTSDAMECLICGIFGPVVMRLPIPIKGIPGGQPSGMMIISADKPAFESYGFNASHTSPICLICATKFSNALNDLLKGKDTHITLPPVVSVFWLKHEDADTDFRFPDLLAAQPQHVRNLYTAPWKAKAEALTIEHNAFYLATLSASGARVVLRDWSEISVGAVVENLQRYFMFHRVQTLQGEYTHFPIMRLAQATINARPGSREEVLARIVQELLHFALSGGMLSLVLLQKVLYRIRADRRVSSVQAALIKAILLSRLYSSERPPQIDMKGDFPLASLTEEELQVPAYLCGRVFAMLDYIQFKALGRVDATISDKNFGTAMVSPALVFPRLLRGVTAHLNKLRQKRNTSATFYMESLERDLVQLVRQLPSAFPKTLTLEEQGRFALGYYQQKAQFLKGKESTDTGLLHQGDDQFQGGEE